MVKSIKLTGRITENKSDKEDIEFVNKKLDQGMTQAAIIREAIRIYREYEEGKLFVNIFSNIEIKKSNDAVDDNTQKMIIRSIDNKFSTGKWGL